MSDNMLTQPIELYCFGYRFRQASLQRINIENSAKFKVCNSSFGSYGGRLNVNTLALKQTFFQRALLF